MYKGRWKRSNPVDKNPDRRRYYPSSPRKESKPIYDPEKKVEFIQESGTVQIYRNKGSINIAGQKWLTEFLLFRR